jgi:hypothetical protein
MSVREKLNAADIRHRREFADYATHDSASDWHRETLDRLYAHWDSANRDHFENACVKPHILLAEPKTPSALGDHANVSGWGSRNQIRLRPTLITGKHKMLKEGDEYAEGRMRYVEDVLLHESVHQYCDEVLHTPETSYKGHGPTFAGECTRIGATLGLPPVRPAKARGKLKDLPSCAQWPMNVRPREYYLGALADPEPKAADEDEAGDEDMLTFPCPLNAVEAVPVLAAHFDQAGKETIAAGLVTEPHEVAAMLLDRFGSEQLAQIWEVIGLASPSPLSPAQERTRKAAEREKKAAKKRGRKPKAVVSPNGDTSKPATKPAKKRGRPPKTQPATCLH